LLKGKYKSMAVQIKLDQNSETEDIKVCPVSSYNEWDPLEEVIVGRVDGAVDPDWIEIEKVTVPPASKEALEEDKGEPYATYEINPAEKELEEFIHILKAEGVVVRRPDVFEHAAPYSTPAWGVGNGFCAANPRDVFLVVGNDIIEAPMPDRSRYFETWPYRTLLKEYFAIGAKWTAAPKPQLLDMLYDQNYKVPASGEEMRYILTEFEPVFDAADFIRCGRDIFAQKSHVTNDAGILWLQRHLGNEYRIHVIETRNPQAMHIDTTLLPLCPGKVMVNPVFLDVNKLPEIFKTWDVLIAPEPVIISPDSWAKLELVSSWIHMNVLMLDEERVIVEKHQAPLIKSLKNWGFKPIPCSFSHYYCFGGSFHCATLDIRRRGSLQSYF